MKELVNTFIEYAPIDTKELVVFIQNKDWEETAKKAHKLKSSIRTIGVTSLSDLILEIELNAKNLDKIELMNQKIDQFNQTLDRVLESLKNEPFINN
jgi:HPt (histidine-containing phosphotransfer) domain-containing protein